MLRIEESLLTLAGRIRGADTKELAQRRAALEADLETMVRCALRNGTGAAGLVRWVRGTLPAVTGANVGEPAAERAAPVLARMLCRTLINQSRQPRPDVGAAGRETVVMR